MRSLQMSDNFLIGQDISRYNNNDVVLDNAAFIWIKSTEGITYQDKTMNDKLMHIAETRADDLPIIGFYHYARPENNVAEREAIHFVNTIKTHIGSCLMALDWEGDAVDTKKFSRKQQAAWINTFCRQVRSRTRVTPFLYISHAAYKILVDFIDVDIPIWIAKYGKKPDVLNAKHPLMWQFTSTPMDLDLWYGTKAQLASYAIK